MGIEYEKDVRLVPLKREDSEGVRRRRKCAGDVETVESELGLEEGKCELFGRIARKDV